MKNVAFWVFAGALGATSLIVVGCSDDSGFDRPVLVKTAPDDFDRLYIVEQTGRVLIHEGGNTLATPFIDATSLVDPNSGNEEGLLGLAFHPNYAQNGRFFLHYTGTNNSETTIMEFARSQNDPLVANPTPVQTVLVTPTEQSNHNGGSIEFGSDGFLYIALGDGGGADDPDCDSQDLTSLLGKILRVDVDGTPDANGYPAAAGNPDGAKYYHVGTRNPWRVSFDACNGDLYIGDVGQNQYEEISHAKASDGARNFGWPLREGAHDFAGYNGNCPGGASAGVDPIAEYTHGGGRCSVTGGYVYRGAAIPALRGYYFYADYCTGQIWYLRYDGTSVVDGPTETGLNGGNVSGFGQDGRGNVYVTDLGGDVFRIDAQ